jgi:hypothetical protein
MNPQTVVSLAAAIIAAVVAITVPRWTFKRTVEHDRSKWVRDKRAELYVDMVAEAYAEHQWFTEQMARLEIAMIEAEDDDRRGPQLTRGHAFLPDTRLEPKARALLGARGTAFASKEVTVAFNKLHGEMGRVTLPRPQSQVEVTRAKWKADELWEDFQQVVRRELGTEVP